MNHDAYIITHVPQFKRGRHGRIIQSPPPMIPHGEGLGDFRWEELPTPRCADCKAEIYYDKITDAWIHQDTADHDARPETIA